MCYDDATIMLEHRLRGPGILNRLQTSSCSETGLLLSECPTQRRKKAERWSSTVVAKLPGGRREFPPPASLLVI